jgi:hypothetical protein
VNTGVPGAAEIAFGGEVSECIVQQATVTGIVEHGILQLERRENRQVECREGSQQHGVRAGLADSASQVARQRIDDLAPLSGVEQFLLVDAGGDDAIAHVVAPGGVRRSEQADRLADEAGRRLASGDSAVFGEGEPEGLTAAIGGRLDAGMDVGKGQRIQLRRHQQNRCHHDTVSAADVHVQDRAHLPTDCGEQPVDLGTGLLFWGRPHPDVLCLSHCFDLSCIA